MEDESGEVTLSDILNLISPGDWSWKLIFFYGRGIAPQNMTIPDFEELVRTKGFSFSWPELLQFAKETKEVYDCIIVVSDADDERTPREIIDSNLHGVLISIEGVDSGTWEVESRDERHVKNVIEKFSKPSSD